jgi:uncharacterized membrane protein
MEAAALVLLVSMFVMVGLSWSELPERVPSHYNAAGEPDRWGSKGSVLILPAVGANLFILLTAFSWMVDRRKVQLNVPPGVDAQSPEVQTEARQLLSAVKLLMTATFAFITWSRTSAPEQGLGKAFLPVMLILPLGVIGLYLVRMRRSR